MTTLRLPYVQRYADRQGRLRHYYRRPGAPRVPLPGLPGSAEFMAAYQAAHSGHATAAPAARSSLSGLIALYYASSEFRQLAPLTKRTYRNITERLRVEHGDKPVAGIQREHVRRLVAAKAETPAAANNLLKQMRILMAFAVAEGLRRDDPTTGVKRLRSKSDGFATWTEADIATYEARWPIGTRERLAFALLLYTGQRRSDVIRMGAQHVSGGTLQVRQQKTGARLALPVHPRLQAILAACPPAHLAFLVTRDGKTFSPAGFGNWFAETIAAAGLSGVSAHGLRKAAARRLAEAGCTAHQIAAVTGHKSLREVEHYTRAADQATGAIAAFGKLGV